MNDLEAALRAQLGAYLSGETTVRHFRDWFVRNTFPIPDDDPASDLAWAIEHMFAEVSTNDLPESELRELLAGLLEPAAHRAAS